MDDTPELKETIEKVKNRRRDAMFCAAYIAVLAMVWIVVYESKLSEYAQGVVTLAIGNFIGYLTAMYNFETGSTRGSAAKDTMITDLTKTAAAATAQAAQVAAATPAPIVANNADITAGTVILNEPKKDTP